MKLRIETKIFGGKIIQQLNSTGKEVPSISGIIERIYDTQELELRKALVALGWKPPKKGRKINSVLKSKEYANLDGKFCPYCNSKQVVPLSLVDVGNDGTGHQNMACEACRKTWFDQYKLVGFIPSKVTGRSHDETDEPDA